MPIRQHTHKFFLKKATKQMVIDGDDEDHVVIPAALGSAAAYDRDTFATAEQGRKADEAHERSQQAHEKSQEAHTKSQDSDAKADKAVAIAESTKASCEAANTAAQESTEKSTEALKISVAAQNTANEAKNTADKAGKDIVEVGKKVDTLQQEAQNNFKKNQAGKLATKDKISLDDVQFPGTKDSSHFLSGTGWVNILAQLTDPFMSANIYDPTNVKGDVFDMDKMREGSNHLILKGDERAKISSIPGMLDQIKGFGASAEAAKNTATGAQSTADNAIATANRAATAITSVNSIVQTIQKGLEDTKQKLSEESKKIEECSTRDALFTGRLTNAETALNEARQAANEAKGCCDSITALTTKSSQEITAATESIKTIKGTADAAKELVEKLKTEVESSKSTANQSKIDASQAKQIAEKAKADSEKCCDDIKDKINTAESKLTAVEQKVTEAETIAKDVKGQFDEVKQKADAAKAKADEVDNKVSALEAASPDAAKAKQALTELQNKITSAQEAAENVKTTASEAKRIAEEAKTDSAEAKQKVSDAETKINEFSSKADRAITQVSELSTQVSLAKTESEQCNQKASEADAKASSAQDKVNVLEGQFTDIQTKSNDAVEQAKNAHTMATQANTAAVAATEAAKQAQKCCDEQKGRITDIESKANNALTTSYSANRKTSEIDGKINALTKNASDAKSAAEEAKTLVANALTTAGDYSSKADREIAALKAKDIELEGKIKSTEDGITSIKTSATEANRLAVEAKSTADTMKQRVDSAITLVNETKNAVSSLKTSVESTAEKITQASEDAETAKSTAEEAKETADSALEKITDLEISTITDDSGWQEIFDATGKANDKSSTYGTLLSKPNTKFPAKYAVPEVLYKSITGFDYANDAPVSRYATSVLSPPQDENWFTEPAFVIKTLASVAQSSFMNSCAIDIIDNVIKNLNLSILSKSSPYLQAMPGEQNRRKLILKAGTTFTIYPKPRASGLKAANRIIGINTDRIISHGIGGGQDPFTPGKDHYVFLLIDWDRVPGPPEVTFAITNNTNYPSGYDQYNAILIGGFHSLCADVGQLDNHELSGYKAGDILPRSVWCNNHRPRSRPSGMVYVGTHDVWVDIYLQSGQNTTSASQYNGVISHRSQDDHRTDLYHVNKQLPTTSQFMAATWGTPPGTKLGLVPSENKTGGHTGLNGKRIISHIGVEDGCGVMWQYLEECSYMKSGSQTVINAVCAGGYYGSSDIGPDAKLSTIGRKQHNAIIAARGISLPYR